MSMDQFNQLTLKVWGDRALFTRPEFKTEQVTYDVITPSAAKGVVEAIFWKPEIRYDVTQIGVLKPIKKGSILRNMIKSRQSERVAQKGGVITIEGDRTQRHALILLDVAYLITVKLSLEPHATDPLAKYCEILRRRISKGQCFQQPYFGCREFVAYFDFPEEDDRPLTNLSTELGLMLHSVNFNDTEAQPRFFRATLRQGVMEVAP